VARVTGLIALAILALLALGFSSDQASAAVSRPLIKTIKFADGEYPTQVATDSAERLRHSGESGIPAAVYTLVFEMPSPEEVAMKKPRELTLKWADGGDPSLQEGGGSEGHRADDGDAP
jgi:hypothetical protein